MKTKNFDVILLIFGVLAIICLTDLGAGIALISMIVVFSLPITFIIAIIPTIFVFLLIARLIFAALKFAGIKVHWTIIAIISGALMAVPPYYMNNSLQKHATNLASSDIINVIKKPSNSTIAIVYRSGYNENTRCDDFCQRALINKQVKRVIRTKGTLPFSQHDWSKKATAYWLEERTICPPFKLRNNINKLNFGSRYTPSKRIRLNAAKGLCLISGPAKLSDADSIIFKAHISKGTSTYGAGLSFTANTVNAYRISYFQKAGDTFKLTYQTTAVTYHKLWPIFSPSLVFGNGMEIKAGFPRTTFYLGEAKKYKSHPSFEKFLTQTLGLNLRLKKQKPDNQLNVISKIIDESSSISPALQTVINDYFASHKRSSKVSNEDTKVILKILTDPRIRIPKKAKYVINNLPKDNPEIYQKIVKSLVQRIATFKPEMSKSWPPERYNELEQIGLAMDALPVGVVKLSPQDFQTLEKLAHNRLYRIFGFRTFKYLAQFKQQALPIFKYLIEDSSDLKLSHKPIKGAGYRNFRYQWERPHVAGLQGICELTRKGFKDHALAVKYIDLIRKKHFPTNDGHKVLFTDTLVGLGATNKEIWQALSYRYHSRVLFNQQMARSRKKVSCKYPGYI